MPSQGCGIEIEWFQVMPHPSYAEVTMETTCGTTQTDGYGRTENRYCAECLRHYRKLCPQGWQTYPGDRCRHGTYVGGMGPDWECGYCMQEEQDATGSE